MNKLLVRVYLFLLIMVAFALIHVGSIQTQIMVEGSFWGYEVIEKNELHMFYQHLNEILRTRFITDSKTYDEIMSSSLESLTEEFEIGKSIELVAVYDDDGNWLKGSDISIDMEESTILSTGYIDKLLRVVAPPEKLKPLMHIRGETTDGVGVTFVGKADEKARALLNAYSQKTYKLNVWSIVIAIMIAFLPIGLFFYFNYIRPLDKLQNAANAIARGQLDVSIESRGLDEIKDFSKAFENMRHELEESRKREHKVLENRQQLITNISHDLRTPITSISGYVEGLLDGKGKNPERMERYLKTIKSKTEYLNGMINDLFLFSQLDMDGYSLELVEYDSRELMERLMEPMELWLDDSDFSLIIQKPYPKVPIKVDYARLSQVVENIVQNSIKYSKDDGQLEIYSYIKNHHFVMSFKDNGIGIKKESMPYIFDAFYREDKSRTQSIGGAGLGLSICKKIVELHEGYLLIDSEFGSGTQVDVFLPLEAKFI